MEPSEVICIVGPTASGKSYLADALAELCSCPVISADSMQVYRGMDIGTAKTPVSDRRVELQMVDVADLREPYSVALFQRQARAYVDASLSAHGRAIVCGGSGLYVRAIIDEMDFPEGERSSSCRQELERRAKTEGSENLYEELIRLDPPSAQLIHPNNVRRVIRALEMYYESGQSYSKQHSGFKQPQAHYSAAIYALAWPRELLYERIARRVDLMFEQGLIEEVKTLQNQGLNTSPTASQAIAYKEVSDYLEGSIDLADCKRMIVQRTCRFAKRQMSWLRSDSRGRSCSITSEADLDRLVDTIARQEGILKS